MQERREAQPGDWGHPGQDSTALMKDNSVHHQSLAQESTSFSGCLCHHGWHSHLFLCKAVHLQVKCKYQSTALSLGTHSHYLNRTSKQGGGNDPAMCALEVMKSSWFVFFLLIAVQKNTPCFSQLLLRPRRNLDPTFSSSPHSAGLRKHGWGRSGSQDMERAVILRPPKPTRPSWLLLARLPESHGSSEQFHCPSFIMPNFRSYYKPPELHIPVERSRFALLPNARAAGVPGSQKKKIYCLQQRT